MVSEAHTHSTPIPLTVQNLADISRLIKELESYEDKLIQHKAEAHGAKAVAPEVTATLQEIAQKNKLSIAEAHDRVVLKNILNDWRNKAPRAHFSFSSEPSPRFLEKLITWLRQEINPQLLISVGLQPAMGAGCTLRTTNKYFDLSLRQTFIAKRQLLLEQLVPESATQTTAPAEAHS